MDESKELKEAHRWHTEKRIEETIAAIIKNNMTGVYAVDRRAALTEILRRIPKGATVSHGGSRTLMELKVDQALERGGYRYMQSGAASVRGSREAGLKDFSCDVYITSVNAITLAGELMALDGFGNRAACLLFGPARVLVVAGKNKIVDTFEDGIKRIREYVAPIHAKRRGWDLPCTKAGRCVNCRSERRICNKLAVVQYEREKERTTVIMVGEDMGI